MAEEEVVAVGVVSPSPLDHKRKFEDLEPEVLESSHTNLLATTDLNVEPEVVEDAVVLSSDDSEPKRPRLDDEFEAEVNENGHREENDESKPTLKDTQPVSEEIQTATIEQPNVNDEQSNLNEDKPHMSEEQVVENDEQRAVDDEQPAVNDEQPAVDNSVACDLDTQHPSVENIEMEKLIEPSKEEIQHLVMAGEGGTDVFSLDQSPTSDIPFESMTRKMEVPNNKVGVLIGKAGDTIRYLQYNSGAKIQIMRDAEADAYSTSRPVQIIGSLENIKKAEKLINAVIAEADAGGSPSLIARGLAPSQVTSAAEQIQIQIQVPNEKVGLIIGRGGETIKSLQTRSGARIQLIPQVLPEGEECKERTVRITGDKMQIDIATEMIKEVMNQTMRPSPFSGGSNQHSYRPRSSGGPSQWGARGPHRSQPTPYDFPQRGPYPSSNPQYPHPAYRNYPPQMGSRSNYGSGWESRPQPPMQGPPSHGAYDYYGGRGHMSDRPVHSQHPNPVHASGPGPAMGAPHVQPNFNYVQQQGPDYGHQYSQPASHQGYGHGYNAGHGSSQPAYPQPAPHTGYAGQQQYDKQASYGMPSQGQPQPYGAPRASQPSEMPYQGATTAQSYNANTQPQPTYPYPTSGSSQQMYPPYGTAPASDGYSQAPPAASGGYPQQAAQAGYGQPVAQQAPVYAQVGPTGTAYGQYPLTQQAYPEQQAPNPVSYGYQAPQDVAYTGVAATATNNSAVPSGQSGYAQQPAAQPSYDQSAPSSGGYGTVPASAQAAYGKTVSPQPAVYAQYDSTQVYAVPR